MATIRINQLPEDNTPNPNDVVPLDNGTTRNTTIQQLVDTGAPVASQGEAEAGANATKRMTPLTTKQAIEHIGAQNFATLAQLEGQVQDYITTTEDARDAAIEARDDAESARDEAEDARDVATSMAGTATGAATTAQTSAGNAMSSANAAAGSADLAQAWATGTNPDGLGSLSAREEADRAEQAAADAQALAGAFRAPQPTIATAQADEPETDPDYYDIAYRDSNFVNNSGGRYKKAASEPTHALKFQNGNGTWYGLDEDEIWTSAAGTTHDGVADDTAAMANLAAYFQARGGGVLHLMPDANYLIDQWDLAAVANLKIKSHGAMFTERTGTGSVAPFVRLGAGVELDHFEYTLPTTLTRSRVIVLLGTGSKLKSWNITAVDQIDNATGSTLNAALIVTGALCHLGSGKVTNFDIPYRWAGADSFVKYAECQSYVRGHWFNATVRGSYEVLRAHTTSPNATQTAGHNAVLFTDPQGTRIGKIFAEDAGEHGVRFGGVVGANDIRIDYMWIKNSGGCGFKVRGDGSTRTRNIYIGAAIIGDSGTGTVPGDWWANEEGVLIERAQNIEFGYLRVYKDAQIVSCARGLVINSSTNIRVNDCSIEDCEDPAIFLENTDDGGTTFRNLTDIYIRGSIKGVGGHAFTMDYTNATFRNIDIDINARNIAGDGFFIWHGGGGALASACVFRGVLNAITGAAVAGNALTPNNSLLSFEYFLDGHYTRYMPSTSTSGILHAWYSNSGSALNRVAVVRADGDLENLNNSYGALSDERIKADVVDAGSQWDDIKAMRVRNFTNRLTGGKHIGLVSQELSQVSPGLVSAVSDEETLETLRHAYPDASEAEIAAFMEMGPILAVKYSIINLKLLKAFQEAQERIEALEKKALH